MSTRRDFVRVAAAASAGRLAFGQAAQRKLNLGLIGCGWYGMVDLEAAYKAGNIDCKAICDVDTAHLAAASGQIEKTQGSKPKAFKDYRELIAMPGLDALIIATPPHWHALPFIAACAKGLDVYQEKPLAYDIREGQAMVNAWKKAGNIVQVGFQRRQPNGFSATREFVRSGQAGRIVQIDARIDYNAGPTPYQPQDPPASLDWDTWCGPAPKLAYSPNIAHKAWRLEKQYGNGHLVDWGIHLIDAIRVIMGFSIPKSVVSVGGLYVYQGRITTPDTLTTSFDFDGCPVVWRHKLWGAADYDEAIANGILLYGEKATVFAGDDRWAVIPRGVKAANRQEIEVPEANEAQARHVANFLDGVRSRKQPVCKPDDAFQSTTTVQLGMIAYYSGAKIEWDAAAGRINGSPEAAGMMEREYRAPYKRPQV
jgi:predicted dehydrogenase